MIVSANNGAFVTTDGVPVNISLPVGERVDSPYIQLEAKVANLSPVHLECRAVSLIDSSFDVENYNKALELMGGKFSYLFA